jgi:hypothetical protein
MFLAVLIGLLIQILALQVSYGSTCWNVGLFEKSQLDPKEKASISGDLNQLHVYFDYESGEIWGQIMWNRIPSSSQTSNLTIGFANQSGDCVTVAEQFTMKGWSKKFVRDWTVAPRTYSPDMLGKLKVDGSTKNALSFTWIGPKPLYDGHLGEHCVKVVTTVPSRYQKTNTTCVTVGNVTNCDGPGWYSGTKEQDAVEVWARSRWSDIDFSCTI